MTCPPKLVVKYKGNMVLKQYYKERECTFPFLSYPVSPKVLRNNSLLSRRYVGVRKRENGLRRPMQSNSATC